MLKIETSFENGMAWIRLYDGETRINALYRPFATEVEARQWFASRGVDSVDNFTNFIFYLLSKGSVGERVLSLLKRDGAFLLNRILGVYETEVRSTATAIRCYRYYSAR